MIPKFIPARRPDSFAAEAAFRQRLAELGATLIEREWLGSGVPHHVVCASGHACRPQPDAVKRGQGICRTCAGNDPAVAEQRFRAVLARMAATLLEPQWLGMDTPHRVRCADGHECRPRPTAVVHGGQGICKTCAGRDPAVAEAAFRQRLASEGATLLDASYLGANKAHHVRCAAGHDCYPCPATLRKGKGICRACAGQDPALAEQAFRAALAKLGATLLEPYKNSQAPHRVLCAAGHECNPRPTVIQRGHGICHECAYKAWDVFYVVAHETEPRVKFGITNMTGQVRLRNHRRSGYSDVVRLVTGLPGHAARDAEDAIRAALADAGEKPVRGREYFDARCLALILDVADSWLAGSVKVAA